MMIGVTVICGAGCDDRCECDVVCDDRCDCDMWCSL